MSLPRKAQLLAIYKAYITIDDCIILTWKKFKIYC